MTDMFSQIYNPDVLSCLANLSNDEVFTPPELANSILDMLPKEIWSDRNATFLDPACKSGVFLREIAKRLINAQLPDYEQRAYAINQKVRSGTSLEASELEFQKRLKEVCEHVFKKQLFGIAITELTSLLSRRSVYCSKYPQSEYSVVRFSSPEGNIDYKQLSHTWRNGKCIYCGASQREYDREKGKESYAYEFIHTDNPEVIFNMKFDVIIGNPPYQLSDGGQKASATPLYNRFVERAKALNPRYLAMIIPARWFDGGRGLDSFRRNMLNDRRIRKLVDFPNSSDCFPGVDIAGGVCYFLWDRDHKGDCEVITNQNGETTHATRVLNQYPTFIRNSKALEIVEKVLAKGEKPLSNMVSSQKPYGLRTFARPEGEGDLTLRWNGGEGPIPRDRVTAGMDSIDKWKVFTSYLTHDHAGKTDKDGRRRIISVLEVAGPGKVCTETYLSIGPLDTESEAENLADYLRTQFARFLILQLTSTQHLSKSNFAFVPIQDFTQHWDDAKLYAKYGISDDEQKYINSLIKPMNSVE